MSRSYMVYYYAELNGVTRKGCLLVHGCTSVYDAKVMARHVLGNSIEIYDVRRQ